MDIDAGGPQRRVLALLHLLPLPLHRLARVLVPPLPSLLCLVLQLLLLLLPLRLLLLLVFERLQFSDDEVVGELRHLRCEKGGGRAGVRWGQSGRGRGGRS